MKLLLVIILSLVSLAVVAQESQEIILDIEIDVTQIEVSHIVDDIAYPLDPQCITINGNDVHLLLDNYEDYRIFINNIDYIDVTLQSGDVIDERDMDISADCNYKFTQGKLKLWWI